MKPPVAVVTGGSRGIGAAICKELAKRGFFVIVNYSKEATKAEAVLNEIKQAGGSGAVLGFDVSDPLQVELAFKQIQENSGTVQVLVNNAGISIDSLLIRLKPEDLDKILSIDLKGAIYCSKEASKQMMKARLGSIIQVSSVVGESGNAGQAAYAAAKAGLIGFTKSVAKELASRQVRANVVTPGFIQTDMTGSLTDSQKEVILRSIPCGELGKPDDVAALVGFLASPESRYITGQVIGVNGGMYM